MMQIGKTKTQSWDDFDEFSENELIMQMCKKKKLEMILMTFGENELITQMDSFFLRETHMDSWNTLSVLNYKKKNQITLIKKTKT